MATGIGANTIIFTLLYGLLLRSLPLKDADSLVRIGAADDATVDRERVSAVPYQLLQQLRNQQKSFTDASAWSMCNVGIETEDGSSRLSLAAFVSGNAFDVLMMNAYLGRLLTPSDDVRGGPAGGWPEVTVSGRNPSGATLQSSADRSE